MDTRPPDPPKLRMHVTCHAERSLPCRPEVAFAMAVDPDRFPAFFTGFGPIPGLRGIRLHAPLAEGSTRRVHSADGAVMTERVTVFDPPVRHAYTLTGLRPPLAWLVRKGEADWTFSAHESGARVTWVYDFTLTRPWAWPVAAPLLRLFMTRAMHRCLKNMSRALAGG